jgi:AraC family transcriptional regulator, regulatory protein of adaptative response / methylated-DNA-[protein]-cysteine methyltransferase
METAEMDVSVGEMQRKTGAGPSSRSEMDELSGRDPGRTVEYVVTETSLGTAVVGVTGLGICAVLFGEDRSSLEADLAVRFPGRLLREADEPGPWARRALACVEGRSTDSGDLALDLKGTEFQKEVWSTLREIPFGKTATYSQLASRIGRPSSVRAVARACGANPLAVVVPCHRVLRGDGSISGYRWGVERKRLLLAREQVGSPE